MISKVFLGLHFVPGVAEYSSEKDRIYISEQTAKQMDSTFPGCPVYVGHVDSHDEKAPDGHVVESFYNPLDGKHWAKFIITTEAGLKAINDGWRLSNAYHPTKKGEGGRNHNVEYKYEVLEGQYDHLAIVQEPRYEESLIMTVDEFKAYNEAKKNEIEALKNSKDENWDLQTVIVSKEVAKSAEEAHEIAKGIIKGDPGQVDETEDSYRYRQRDPKDFDEFRTKDIEKGVSIVYARIKKKNSIGVKFMFSIFKKEKIENSDEVKNLVVTLKNGDEISVEKLIDMANKKNEDEEAKKKEEEEAKKNADEEEAKKKEEDAKKNADEEAAKKKKEEEEKEEEENKKNEIKNAMETLANDKTNHIQIVDKVARGKSLYGSNK